MRAPIVLAVDTTDLERARTWVHAARESISIIKLGLEFFLSHGQSGVEYVRGAAPDLQLFLDLKLHDIPNTVAGATRAIAQIKPDYLTVHASGGAPMVSAAVAELPEGKVTAVTLLTSLSENEVSELGISGTPSEIVTKWALGSVSAGARAIVASAHEVKSLRALLPPEIVLITPGVRPRGSDKGDQSRVATPEEAILWGANFVVIGRPITSGATLEEITKNAARIASSF
jgi:orotidine-5'-phosphate decarboxylase